MSAEVFSKKDPTAVSPGFRSALEGMHRKLHEGAGEVSRFLFAALCRETGKAWPTYLLQAAFEGTRYDTFDGEHGACLTAAGFAKLMEEACFSDLPWVARVADLMKQKDAVTRLLEASGSPHPVGVPLLTGDRGTLHPNIRSSVQTIYNMFKAPDGTLPVQCLQGFIGRVEAMGIGEAAIPPEQQLAALTRTLVAGVFPEARGDEPFSLSEEDFASLFREWCAEDELHAWRILHEFGCCLDTGGPKMPVVNVHVSSDCQACNDAFSQEEARREAQVRLQSRSTREDLLVVEKLQGLIASNKREVEVAKLNAANKKLEVELQRVRRRMAEAKGGVAEPAASPRGVGVHRGTDARSERLARENKSLRKRLQDAPSPEKGPALVKQLEGALAKKVQELQDAKQQNRDLTQLSRRSGNKAVAVEGMEAKVQHLQTGNDVVVAGLKRRIAKTREETASLRRTEAQQLAEIERLPKDLPQVNTKEASRMLMAWDEAVRVTSQLQKELTILRRANKSEKEKLRRLTTETVLHNSTLQLREGGLRDELERLQNMVHRQRLAEVVGDRPAALSDGGELSDTSTPYTATPLEP
eukprot:TRINITY_DN4209_c1_g1_i2.p1 TRINITY_DN4209_c1_g1~~TRINITY_DN4209_c1_g1_i2.p1  ORF type:complete len:583 (+),score=230.75 TRINITY_DN4209_c1_g1_i2:725-2473(+)